MSMLHTSEQHVTSYSLQIDAELIILDILARSPGLPRIYAGAHL